MHVIERTGNLGGEDKWFVFDFKAVLYTPPPSPSGLRGQSEQSENSPKTVRGV